MLCMIFTHSLIKHHTHPASYTATFPESMKTTIYSVTPTSGTNGFSIFGFCNASPFSTGAYAQQTPCQRKIHLDNVLPWRERDRLSMASAVQSAHKDIN